MTRNIRNRMTAAETVISLPFPAMPSPKAFPLDISGHSGLMPQ